MKRLGEADIRLGTVGETKAEADRKAGKTLVIKVETCYCKAVMDGTFT